MQVTDPFGRVYRYAGEKVRIIVALSDTQHRGCYEAAGIPAPDYLPGQEYVTVETAAPGDADRLRRFLREHGIEHRSELAVTYQPDSEAARELTQLLEQLRSAPAFPGALESAARLLPHNAGGPAAVEALFDSVGAGQAQAAIADAQRRESDARELIALAEQLGLDDAALDEAVHDSRPGDASQINNEGREAQIRHLVQTNSTALARELIRQAAP
jgi:2-hydroxychromene-2-carboxylate isomerase